MAGHGRRRGGHEEQENDERWLLTYADMITLLMALFMVLFSISSVNISKYRTLQLSLKAAFSGNILPGGRALLQPGATSNSSRAPTSMDVQTIVPLTPRLSTPATEIGQQALAANHEQSSFKDVQALIKAYAKSHGIASSVSTSIQSRGLVVQILTDHVLFASGSATIEARGKPLLAEIAGLLNIDQTNPLVVEGYTDDVPIDTAQFSSNWALSAARASNVVEFLIAHDVSAYRLGVAGYAQLHPIASNATATGRARNRRVQIVLQRVYNYNPGS